MDFTVVLRVLWQGNYVEFSLLEHYLGLTFGECMKKFAICPICKME